MLADLYKNSEGERHCVLKGNRVDYDENLYIYNHYTSAGVKSHLNFRLADVHKVGDCVSVIGASTFPNTKFYDYQGNEQRFPSNRELIIQAEPDASATSNWSTFTQHTEDNGPIFVDKNNIAEATSALYRVTTANKNFELPPVVDNWYKWTTSHEINSNYIERKNLPSFVVPFLDDRYSAMPPISTNLIKDQWSRPIVVTVGDPDISITFQGQDGWHAGSDYSPRTRFAVSHTGNVKMGVECIFSGDGLTNYLESPRDAASYDGLDGWFNLITKGLHGVSMDDHVWSAGYTKFYDMKKLTKIANDTYYLRDDDYYTITNSDNYAGTSACVKVTMFAAGAPYALLCPQPKAYLIKATNRSSPGMYTYFDGFTNNVPQWKSNNFLSCWHSDTEAGAESQKSTLYGSYASYMPYGTTTELEVVHDYYTCTFKPICDGRDFPASMNIYAMNYHFRPA